MKIQEGQFFDEETFKGIMRLEEESYPAGTAYDDQEEYYQSALKNPQYINVVARKGERVIGYLLITPQPDAVVDLKIDDPELIDDPDCLYIETMEIDPEIRKGIAGGRIFILMIKAAEEEAIRRGYKRVCTHVRKSTGINVVMKKYLGIRIIKTREIPKWRWVANEPYEYVEGRLTDEY